MGKFLSNPEYVLVLKCSRKFKIKVLSFESSRKSGCVKVSTKNDDNKAGIQIIIGQGGRIPIASCNPEIWSRHFLQKVPIQITI